MIEYRNRSLAYRCRYPYPRFDRPIALPRGVLRGLLQDRMPRHRPPRPRARHRPPRPPRGLFGFLRSCLCTRLLSCRVPRRHASVFFAQVIVTVSRTFRFLWKSFLWIAHAHAGRALRGWHLAPRQAGILFGRCRTHRRDRPYPFKHGLHVPLQRASPASVVFGIARPPSSAWSLRSLRCLFL